MNEDLKYRKAEPADAERIMEIIRQAQAQMRALGSLQWQDGYPARTDIDNDIARGYGYVFEKSDAAEEPAAAKTPQKCDKGRVSGAVIAYGAVVFDGEPAYGAIDGAWLTGGRLRRPAPAGGGRRGEGPRRGGGVHAAPKRWPANGASAVSGWTPISTTATCCGCSNGWDSPTAAKSSTEAVKGWLSRNPSKHKRKNRP